MEGILFIWSYLAILIVASAGLAGPFVTDANLDTASAMPETYSMRLATSGLVRDDLEGSPEFKLCQISEKKPAVLDKLAAERKGKENAELARQASQFAEEFKELTGEEPNQLVFGQRPCSGIAPQIPFQS